MANIKTKDLTQKSIGATQVKTTDIKVQSPEPKAQLKLLNSKRKDLKQQIKDLDKEERQIKKTINSSKKKPTKK